MSRRAWVLSCALCVLPGVAFAQAEGGAPPPEGGGQGGPPPQGPPPAPPPPNPKVIRKLRQRFEREPTVSEVQRAALRFFRVNPERVEGYMAGASWKALMPDLEVNFNNEMAKNDRTLKDAIYLTRFPDGKEFEDTRRLSYVIGVRAHWALDRLIFNAETLDVTSLVGVQEGLLREITSLYFTRRRLLTAMALNPPQDPGEQITESIRLDEITANLDALSGGYLSREVRKRVGE